MTKPTPIPASHQWREGATAVRQCGFTLIELIIFIVVVSVGMAGILQVMNTVVKSSADPMVRKQSIAVAESMLEEILLKEYCDPDTVDVTTTPHTCGALNVETTRNLYDDVRDYAGYSTSAGIVTPDAVATPVVGLASYNLSPAVAVNATTLNGIAVLQVTVSVTSPQGTISLIGYRANY
jgi:MSHA pilin protein MshD